MVHSENLGLFQSHCPCSSLVGLPGFGYVSMVVKTAGWVLLVCHELLLTSQLVGSGLRTRPAFGLLWPFTHLSSPRGAKKKYTCKMSSSATHISQTAPANLQLQAATVPSLMLILLQNLCTSCLPLLSSLLNSASHHCKMLRGALCAFPRAAQVPAPHAICCS